MTSIKTTQISKTAQRWLLGVLTLLAFGLASSQAMAQKIVVANVQEAIKESKSAQRWIKKFESEHSKEQSELRALESELKKMQERFKRDGAVMSEDQKRKASKSMKEKYEEFQFRGKQLQDEFKEGQQELLQTMLPKVNKALNELMKKKGYDLILHREAVLMLKPGQDITKELINKLNK